MISTQVSDKNLELKDFTNWDWFTPKYYNKKCKKGKCEPETVAKTDLPVKRRSSFEPEAAEEVKEDDKEEKKGFSMWESISRSVTPPAPSGTESPIHVKIDE